MMPEILSFRVGVFTGIMIEAPVSRRTAFKAKLFRARSFAIEVTRKLFHRVEAI